MKNRIKILSVLMLLIVVFVSSLPATQLRRMQIWDSGGTEWDIEANGGGAVNIQDQHTRTGDVFFSQIIGSPASLSIDAVIDEYTITMTAGHGILEGEQLVLYDTVSARLYIGGALTVATNLITLDVPLNYSYPSATSVLSRSTKDMNVDGSSTRQAFEISVPIGLELDITNIRFVMTTTNFPELDMFGDIEGGITRGVVLRVVNDINVNYYNVKNNGDLALLHTSIKEYTTAKHGVNGWSGEYKIAGQQNHGVTIRLAEGDVLQAIVPDDLTSIISYRMLASFHVVGD